MPFLINTFFPKTQLGVRVVEQYVVEMKASKPTKAASKKMMPSVMEMIQQDTELKDFFKLVQENDFRDKAVTLLRERIQQMK